MVGATLVFVLLWLIPLTSILNNEILLVYNKYRGYIGFIALVLLLITLVRILITLIVTTSHKFTDWSKGRPRRKAIEKTQNRILRRIPYLDKNQREFLKSLINNKQQQFTLPRDNDNSWIGEYADVLMADIVIPDTEYKIKPWVWKYLNNNISVLDVEEIDETKQRSQA